MKRLNRLVRIAKEMIEVKSGIYYCLSIDDLIDHEELNELELLPVNEINVETLLCIRKKNTVDVIKSEINKGSLFFEISEYGKCVGHIACILPVSRYAGFQIKKSAYIYFAYVEEKSRGRGIYPQALSLLIKRLNNQFCISEFSISTSNTNYSSQRGIEKVGFKKSGSYNFVRIRKWYLGGRTV